MCMCNWWMEIRCHQLAARFTRGSVLQDGVRLCCRHPHSVILKHKDTPYAAFHTHQGAAIGQRTFGACDSQHHQGQEVRLVPRCVQRQVRPARLTQHATLVTSLTECAANSIASSYWPMLGQTAGSSHRLLPLVSRSERSAPVWQFQKTLLIAARSRSS